MTRGGAEPAGGARAARLRIPAGKALSYARVDPTVPASRPPRRFGNWENRVEVEAMESAPEQVNQGFDIMEALSWRTGGRGCGIGIMNIMRTNVTERTRMLTDDGAESLLTWHDRSRDADP